jgi:PKD-like domain
MPSRKSILWIVSTSFLTTVRLAAECSSLVAVSVPPTACKSGTATAAVAGIPGATYAWTVVGGQITGDATNDSINITLGTNAKATVSVTMTAGGCVSSGSGVIALHDPFNVRINAIPATHASEPLTIIWAYENGAPAQQTISGGDFGSVTLPPDARNYTYTPQTSGSEQFAIDAIMVMPSNLPPVTSRRRSVSKSPASASTCASAHASAEYTVGTCVTPTVVVDGPDTVVTGTTFQLVVRAQSGAVATWTISNGSPATATGDTVNVTAGSSGAVGVSVRLTRGACVGQLDRSIAITAAPVCDNPKAFVTTGPLSCGSAIVNASFTGTPPFTGFWSDGLSFTTANTALTRTVTMPGNYSIKQFQDATCEGPPSGVAVVPPLIPTATIFGKASSCTSVDSATVLFTGKPPFSGCWSDGTCFQTSQMQITKLITAAGTNTLSYGTDGNNCPLTITGAVQGFLSPRISINKHCQWSPTDGNTVALYLNLVGSFVYPVTVTWTDGVTSGERFINPPPSQTTTYTIAGVSAHNGPCAVIFDPPQSVTVYPNPLPDFTLVQTICTGATGMTSLNIPPPPGTQVHWVVENGAIISGQGTNTIQYQAGAWAPSPGMGVLCTFTFADPNRCPLTTQRTSAIDPVDPFVSLQLDYSNVPVHAGTSTEFQFRVGDGASHWSFDDSMNDTITQQGVCTNNGDPCHALYTSTHGPGQSTITIHVTNTCGTKDVSTVLTILP